MNVIKIENSREGLQDLLVDTVENSHTLILEKGDQLVAFPLVGSFPSMI
jgi:hypothetical protein